MRQRLQPELFDESSLVQRLMALGLRGVRRVESHENQSVMVSVTGAGVLRVHRGYAYAPDSVLAAIVRFVRPGTPRRIRTTVQREILAFPVHAFAPPRARRRRRPRTHPADRPLLRELADRHQRFNALHFDGVLSAIRFRVSRRMVRKLGELTIDPSTGRPVEIAISHRHVLRDGWREVEHTLLHEMIHQWQAETGLPVDHGAGFREKARAIGVVPRAMRDVPTARHRQTKD